MEPNKTYLKKIEAKPSFPELEAQVLARWKKEQTYEKSLEKNKAQGQEFIFYDGPPFPTGNPHHGTIFVSILKDIIPRYKTMRGYYVPRAWGWDCHGLPIETLAEKNLGIKEKREIEQTLGVKAFNAECRRIVSEFNESWEAYIDKLGRWVSFKTPYQTLDRSFMESVIWSFAESHKKGLIYKDYRVTPYCYRCETPLSISDTRLDDSTRPRQDRAITVPFKVKNQDNLYILAWTTTPWTLPSNLALAVGKDITYATVKHNDKFYLIAEARIASYAAQFGKTPEIVNRQTGAEILDLKYEPLLPYFAEQNPNGFKVLAADFVSTEDGTGVVHMAPAFGEDDYWTCRRHEIAVIAPVDEKGCFDSRVSDFAGRNVHEANSDIIKFLKQQDKVFQDATLEHNYPHCWRCRNALIYKAVDAWYFSVEKIKDDLIKNNQEINWQPESVKDGRFGKWLENARDWNISRNRYWATPIPVWECHDCGHSEVLGSLAELEAKAGKELPDLHKEFLDEIKYPCCKCSGSNNGNKNGIMQRTSEVLDGWYESGSMPYGQFHYPFSNAEHFRSHFPADFIVEYVGQIRGWFYYLHVLSTALFNKPAFKNCLVTGTLLAADGKKISKSQKNYTDPMDLINKYGADAFRAYLLSSPSVQMADMAFKDEGLEGMIKNIILPLWNALSFFTTYAETDEIELGLLNLKDYTKDLKEVDQYILSEIELLKQRLTEQLDIYAIHEATKLFPDFLDTLTNWFIRRSRQRVWSSDKRDRDKLCFYATCYYVLENFCKLLAPFCPFVTEIVWERLGNSASVHLESWPEVNTSFINHELSERINLVRRIISAGLSIRSREKIRVRQPLNKIQLVINSNIDLTSQTAALAEELNVKNVEFLSDESLIAERVGKANARELGPIFGKDMQKIIQAVKLGEFEVQTDGKVKAAGFEIPAGLIEIVYKGKEGIPVESTTGAVVAMDIAISKELATEGLARDLVRQIQELRKEGDLNVGDRIFLAVMGLDEVVKEYEDYIKGETLAVGEISIRAFANCIISKEVEIDECKVRLQIALNPVVDE